MVFCVNCKDEVELEVDETNGFSCCAQCGRVHEDIAFSSDVLFQKGADGEGGMVGQIVGQTTGGLSRGAYAGGEVTHPHETF
jgi:transcription factor IIIB subunit 2